MLAFIRKHPIGVGAAAVVAGIGLAWLAFGFFAVQTLFIDDVVDEGGPVFDAEPAAVVTEEPVATTPTVQADSASEPVVEPPVEAVEPPAEAVEAADPVEDVAPVTTAPAVPEIVSEYVGSFESGAHPTSGIATVLGNGTGQRFLRFENFATDNGPDLNVYLVNSSTGDVSDFIDLGDLKGNIGDQNYELAADVDLDVYDEVVIWCVRFGVGFGDALLAPA